MVAILFSSAVHLPAWVYALLVALSCVSLVVLAREFGKRTACVALVALVLFAPVIFAADDTGVVVYSECDGLGPGDWLYWARGCWGR